MLDSLITSKTRVKLLLKFFSNRHTQAYLRELALEFGESTNSVRLELNRLAQAGLLKSKANGNTKLYRANTGHPLFPELNKLVIKYFGFNELLEEVIHKLGKVQFAFVTGDYALGKDSGIIDLVLVGKIDWDYLLKLIQKAESISNRKVRPLVLSEKEFQNLYNKLSLSKAIILWTGDEEKLQELIDTGNKI